MFVGVGSYRGTAGLDEASRDRKLEATPATNDREHAMHPPASDANLIKEVC